MTEVTDEELCLQVQQGNSQAVAELLKRNEKLIHYVAYKVYRNALPICRSLNIEIKDLEQEGALALIPRIAKYSEEKDASFSTYCGTVVRNALIDYLRDQHKIFAFYEKYTVESWESLNKQISSETGSASFGTPPEPAYIRKETLEELNAARQTVPARDRIYLDYRCGYYDGKAHKLRETAMYFHLSAGRCRYTEKEALRHMREKMRTPQETIREARLKQRTAACIPMARPVPLNFRYGEGLRAI